MCDVLHRSGPHREAQHGEEEPEQQADERDQLLLIRGFAGGHLGLEGEEGEHGEEARDALHGAAGCGGLLARVVVQHLGLDHAYRIHASRVAPRSCVLAVGVPEVAHGPVPGVGVGELRVPLVDFDGAMLLVVCAHAAAHVGSDWLTESEGIGTVRDAQQ
jgi:hypothetical protein